jgi:hypothetical protein
MGSRGPRLMDLVFASKRAFIHCTILSQLTCSRREPTYAPYNSC